MDYLSSISSFNLDDYTAGADTASPLGDVSWGAEPMQTSTPTGNGSGVFLDTSWQNALFGAVPKVIDYALQRDAYRMGMAAPLGQPSTQQQVQVQGKQTNFMFLALCGLGLYLVINSGGAK